MDKEKKATESQDAIPTIAILQERLNGTNKRLSTVEGALYELIGKVKAHTHDEQGRACQPII